MFHVGAIFRVYRVKFYHNLIFFLQIFVLAVPA